jgi:hypothetical protein
MPPKVFKRRGPGSLPSYLISHTQPLHPIHHSIGTFLLHSPTHRNLHLFHPLFPQPLCCNKNRSTAQARTP